MVSYFHDNRNNNREQYIYEASHHGGTIIFSANITYCLGRSGVDKYV